MAKKKVKSESERWSDIFKTIYNETLCKLSTRKVSAGKLIVNHQQYQMIVYWCPNIRTSRAILHFSLFRKGCETVHGYVPIVSTGNETTFGSATCYYAKEGRNGNFDRAQEMNSHVDVAIVKSTKRILKFFHALDCPGPV